MVDEFILYDDMQYTKRDWRNRNIIKTVNGLQWLTIPVEVKGKYSQKINETKISDKTWTKRHWKTITHNYSKASYFKQHSGYFEELYLNCVNEDYLSRVNFKFLQGICAFLNINTRISWSSDYLIDERLKKTERLIDLCQKTKATHYLSGPSAQAYIQANLFEAAGIEISYADYSGYLPYSQLFGKFEHGVSILDLILNMGSEAHLYLKSSPKGAINKNAVGENFIRAG
ncbi:hypothetical protein AQULUS_05330 [Aquicella lusitana]|uniref:WbqC-like protein n=2 Tax=Aquicella lusitana TaxID=254246 RepID=A0A370FXU3_9COXI|nr:WbqC-like protein [Aquicella lusitana]VVC72809.1 hypothetical protein AQULUS_05330 [Aquicella lusitana]